MFQLIEAMARHPFLLIVAAVWSAMIGFVIYAEAKLTPEQRQQRDQRAEAQERNAERFARAQERAEVRMRRLARWNGVERRRGARS